MVHKAAMPALNWDRSKKGHCNRSKQWFKLPCHLGHMTDAVNLMLFDVLGMGRNILWHLWSLPGENHNEVSRFHEQGNTIFCAELYTILKNSWHVIEQEEMTG